MIERDPIGNDARERRKSALLGREPACLVCGESDRDKLIPVGRSIIEQHHVAGIANDRRLTVPLCRNHHAELTAGQVRAGMELEHEPARTMPERLVQVLHGLALLFETVGSSLEGWAEGLAALTAALDARYPEWRQLLNGER